MWKAEPMKRKLVLCTLVSLLAACGGSPVLTAQEPPSRSGSASPAPFVSPSPTPPSSPSPSPPPDYGAPPAGVDLFYVQVTGYPAWLIGYDWQGHARATIHLKEVDNGGKVPFGISVAPNGSGFTAGEYTFDRTGKVIYQYTITGKEGGVNTWSEDAAVLCGVKTVSTMTNSSTAQGYTDFYLMRRTPTTSPVTVARFLHVGFIPGDMGYNLYACTHWLDRALVVKTVCCSYSGATTLRLSDGAILGTWGRDAGQPVFSPDGQLIADPTLDTAGNTRSTVVSTLLGGVVIARYGPAMTFRAMSRDNRSAVVMVADPGGPVAEVIQISTRRVVWRDSSSRSINAVWTRPGSGDIAIAFTASPQKVQCNSSVLCTNPESNVVIVHPDGTANAISGDFLATAQPWAGV